jgi:hypothetical protein
MGFGQNKGKVKQQNWVIKDKKGRCGDIWVQSKRFSEKWVTRPHDSLKKETGMVFKLLLKISLKSYVF